MPMKKQSFIKTLSWRVLTCKLNLRVYQYKNNLDGGRWQADCSSSSRAWYILSAQKVVWKVAICICRQGWKTFSSVFVVFLPSWPGSPKMTATGPLLVVIVLRIRSTMWNKANFYIDTESTSWFLERILSKTILGLSIRWKLLMILMKN